MSTTELRPLTPRPRRNVALAALAVVATTAVIAGLILATVGLVRTSQLSEANRRNAQANSANVAANKRNLTAQCEAQKVIIQNQARGIRDGAALFATVLPPDKLKAAIKASKHDLRRLKHVRAKLHCPAPRGQAAGLVIPDTVLNARHRPRDGESATPALGGGTSNGPAPQSPSGPPAGGPAPSTPSAPSDGQQPAPAQPELPRVPQVCGTAQLPLLC